VSEHATHAHGSAHDHAHFDPDMFTERAWEERYRAGDRIWSGNPNPQLVSDATGLTTGTALDVGCGEGADAIWLAERGWRVTAVDFATAALERAAAHAAERGPDVAGRISWVHADLTAWGPGAARFDLVSAQFMHLPTEPRTALYARLAGGVATGGTLLIVGHHPGDLESDMSEQRRDMMFTADEVAAALDPAEWEIVAAETRARTVTDPAVPHHQDVVLNARRR
jgi:SAM-dependent methyltransferase